MHIIKPDLHINNTDNVSIQDPGRERHDDVGVGIERTETR